MSMFNINTIFLAGNVTKDGELKQTKTGKSVVKFSIATNESIKKDDEWVSVPTFHDIIIWGKLGESVVDYLKKGSKCMVQGRIVKRSWEHEGKKYYATEVNAEKVMIGASTTKAVKKENVEDALLDNIADEIPF